MISAGMRTEASASSPRRRRPAEDQHIAWILALEHAGESDAGRQGGLEVFEAVHREIDAVVDQRLMDFLGEQALAADLGERTVQH
jgi:hypothetical protein